MKKIFSFIVNKKEIKVEPEVIEVNGEQLTRNKNVETLIPHTFFIRKPNRALQDEAELYFGIKVSEGIKAGLLTRQLIAKRYDNDGGIFAEPSVKRYEVLMKELAEKTAELERMGFGKNPAELTEEQKTTKDKILEERNRVHSEIIRYENTVQSLYSSTAESRAERKMLVWWILRLAYKVDGDKEIPYFGEGTIEDRLTAYDAIEDSVDEFTTRINSKFMFLISAWYKGNITTEQEFKEIEKAIDKEIDSEFSEKVQPSTT
jgi:hypothetical protein